MINQILLDDIERAVYHLNKGNIGILPTETVYGLAGDACNRNAIAKIYQAKGRPAFNPLIAHMLDIAMVEEYCVIDPLSLKLIEAFWPGPLTLILPLKNNLISNIATAGLSTLAVRSPRGIFNEVLRAFKKPIVAPSANLSGRISPTSLPAALIDLRDKVDFYLDGGECSIGIESTIIKVTSDSCYLLRPGGLSSEDLITKLDRPLKYLAHDQAIEAPGMLKSHYAPKAKVRLQADQVFDNEAILLFGNQPIKDQHKAKYILNLSENGNFLEAASNLFSFLSQLDKPDIRSIAVQRIPNRSLGLAINDRLKRAAAERDINEMPYD